MNTSIYTRQELQLLPQMVNVWVYALLSRRKIEIISSQVWRLCGRYLFQVSPYVGYVAC